MTARQLFQRQLQLFEEGDWNPSDMHSMVVALLTAADGMVAEEREECALVAERGTDIPSGIRARGDRQ